MKKIIIAGGKGFLGQALEQYFTIKGYEVIILTRAPKLNNHCYWDGKTLGNWITALENADVLINLAGKSVDCRYTKKNKKEILQSRAESTRALNKALRDCPHNIETFICASSATIYEHSMQHLNTEIDGKIGSDFSMDVVKMWEKTFFKKSKTSIRRIGLRTSIVLGQLGGAFPKLKAISKLGLGGKQGSGKQWISWIHIEDFCQAVSFILEDKTIQGPVNITSPNPIKNKDFMKLLRGHLNISFGLSQCRFLLEIGSFLIRTETELLLKSRNVFPELLLQKGFIFNHSHIDSALKELTKTDI